MSEALGIERDGATWCFTLRRPKKRNALSADLVDALLQEIEEAHGARARVLVFRGEGRNLSAGFDFGGFEEQSEGDLVLRFARIEMLLQRVANSPCLTVGFAHGKNFGAGVDLFAVCRRRIATADATFRMPGLRFGLVLGTRRFASIVGSDAAGRILQEAATFDAAQAASMGFVESLAEPDDWPAVIAEAERQAAGLSDDMRSTLYRTLKYGDDNDDLADLVRSAAEPGLKDRIRAYLAAA